MKTKLALLFLMFSGLALSAEPEAVNSIEFKGRVDLILIKVQGNQLWVESHVGKPERMFINSRTFNPKWQGHKSDMFTKFETPLKTLEGATVALDVKRGRSVVEIVEQPAAGNDWTLTVKIADQPADSDIYNIKLTW